MILHLLAVCPLLFAAAPVSERFKVLVSSSVYVHHTDTTILPCWIDPPRPTEGLEVRWYQEDHSNPIILHQNNLTENQEPRYTRRVSFGLKDASSGGLKVGDVSMKLQNVSIQDDGHYTCYVIGDAGYDYKQVRLHVTKTGNDPHLYATRIKENQLNVSCESEGWYPKPELRWFNHTQDLKPQSLTYSTVSSGSVSVHSWLLVPDSSDLSCLVGFLDKDGKGLSVHLKVIPAKEESGPNWVAGWVTFALLLFAVLASVGVFYYRRVSKMKSGSRKDSSNRSQVELKLIPADSEGSQSTPLTDFKQETKPRKDLPEVKPTDLAEAKTHHVKPTDLAVAQTHLATPSTSSYNHEEKDKDETASSGTMASTSTQIESAPLPSTEVTSTAQESLIHEEDNEEEDEMEEMASSGTMASSSAPIPSTEVTCTAQATPSTSSYIHKKEDMEVTASSGTMASTSTQIESTPLPSTEVTSTAQVPKMKSESQKDSSDVSKRKYESQKDSSDGSQVVPADNEQGQGTPRTDFKQETKPRKDLPEVKPTDLAEAQNHHENIKVEVKEHKYIIGNGEHLREKRDLPPGAEDTCLAAVRGTPGFSSGQHYWEVSLEKPNAGVKQSWWIGVTNADFSAFSEVTPTTSNGFWFLSSSRDRADSLQLNTEPKVYLPVQSKPSTVGVYLNYDTGELTFYDRHKIIGSLAAEFTGEVFPLFNPGRGDQASMSVRQWIVQDQRSDAGEMAQEPLLQ